MTADPVEARISAYLDDELSADERAQVETLLAENAAARQFHEELRAVRASLKSVERHKLDERFTAEVMRRARQAALDAAAEEQSRQTVLPAPLPLEESFWRRSSNLRRWVWPAAAVAAALAILLYDSTQRTEERQVAQAPEDAETLDRSTPQSSRLESAAPKAAPAADDLRWSAPPEAAAERSANGAVGDSAQSPEMRDMPSRRMAAPAPGVKSESEFRNMPATQPAPLSAPLVEEPRSAPAEGAAPAAAPMLRSLAKSRSAVPLQVDFEVPAEYLREKRFEALLTQQKVAWKPSAGVATAASKKEALEALQEPRDESARDAETDSSYLVTVTREQFDALVAQLPQQSAALGRVSNQFDLYFNRDQRRASGVQRSMKPQGLADDNKANADKTADAKPDSEKQLAGAPADKSLAEGQSVEAKDGAVAARAIVIRLRAAGNERPAAAAATPAAPTPAAAPK